MFVCDVDDVASLLLKHETSSGNINDTTPVSDDANNNGLKVSNLSTECLK